MRPENGHVGDELYAAEDAIPAADIARDADALFCCEFVFEEGNQGILFALGDDTTGLLVGINGDGELVARFGDGAAAPLTNGARVVVPAGLVPKDREIRLSVAVHISEPAEIVVWFDGRQVARADMEGTLTDWAANANGAYIDTPAAIPDETGITAAYDGTVLSALRYHARRAEKYRTGV